MTAKKPILFGQSPCRAFTQSPCHQRGGIGNVWTLFNGMHRFGFDGDPEVQYPPSTALSTLYTSYLLPGYPTTNWYGIFSPIFYNQNDNNLYSLAVIPQASAFNPGQVARVKFDLVTKTWNIEYIIVNFTGYVSAAALVEYSGYQAWKLGTYTAAGNVSVGGMIGLIKGVSDDGYLTIVGTAHSVSGPGFTEVFDVACTLRIPIFTGSIATAWSYYGQQLANSLTVYNICPRILHTATGAFNYGDSEGALIFPPVPDPTNSGLHGYDPAWNGEYFSPFDGTRVFIGLNGFSFSIGIVSPNDYIETTILGTVTMSGNATVTVTAANMVGSPIVLSVAVTAGDSAGVVTDKISTALLANSTITSFFTVMSIGAFYGQALFGMMAQASAPYDVTMQMTVTNGTCTGLIPVTSSHLIAAKTQSLPIYAQQFNVDGTWTTLYSPGNLYEVTGIVDINYSGAIITIDHGGVWHLLTTWFFNGYAFPPVGTAYQASYIGLGNSGSPYGIAGFVDNQGTYHAFLSLQTGYVPFTTNYSPPTFSRVGRYHVTFSNNIWNVSALTDSQIIALQSHIAINSGGVFDWTKVLNITNTGFTYILGQHYSSGSQYGTLVSYDPTQPIISAFSSIYDNTTLSNVFSMYGAAQCLSMGVDGNFYCSTSPTGGTNYAFRIDNMGNPTVYSSSNIGPNILFLVGPWS